MRHSNGLPGIVSRRGGLSMLLLGALLMLGACDDDARREDAASLKVVPVGERDTAGAVVPLDKAGAPKIVVKQGMFTPEQLRELESAVPEARFIFVGNDDPDSTQMAQIGDADALMTDWVTPQLVRAGKSLRWIQHYAAGVDDLMFPELVESEIVLTNCKIVQGPEIADHALAMLLALTRRLNETIPVQRDGQWNFGRYRKSGNLPTELNGRTALIIGLGGIGMQIAQRAHAFGMTVVATDPKDIPYIFFVRETHPPDRLHALLPQADVVFVTAPLTPSTRKMIGVKEFALMKKGSYFIALSRGPIVDTDALVQALKEKRLAGAGLDVVDPSPLPKGHPLWKFDNVIITPHMSGQSDRVWERRLELFKKNAQRFAKGEPLLHVVDKSKGY